MNMKNYRPGFLVKNPEKHQQYVKQNGGAILTAAGLLFFLLVGAILVQNAKAQSTVSGTEFIRENHYFLSLPGGISSTSTMSYDPDSVDANGGAFVLSYADPGGSGMDGYPNGGVGGCKTGGKWEPGDSSLTGMPVLLKNLPADLWLYWKSSQDNNAFDDDDKWESSVNFIFDFGSAASEPVAADRDFDLVILLNQHNFEEELEDLPRETATDKYWYFARNSNNSIRPYIVSADGIDYPFAVRYNFFKQGDKADKVHVKFIPVNTVPPCFHEPIHKLLDTARSFISSAALNETELTLAHQKVAPDSIWLKSIRGGYEVYTGQSTLRQIYIKTVTVDTPVTAISEYLPARLGSIRVKGESILFGTNGTRTVELYGINGRKLYSQKISGETFIIPANLSGVIVGRISGDNKVQTVKMVR